MCLAHHEVKSIDTITTPIVVTLCRATARVTTGQRKSLDQVEEVQQKQGEDGGTYWTYDHISQVYLVADRTHHCGWFHSHVCGLMAQG